jgi:hypothetical protein
VAWLAALDITDDSAVWDALGFAVVDGAAWVDGVAHRLGAAAPAWSLAGVELPPGPCDVDGLATIVVADPPDLRTDPHPNGVIGLDHVVVGTPDHARTVGVFEKAGMPMLRMRETDTYGAPMRQAFFRLGPVIVEVIGGATATGDGPAGFFGLAWTSSDLDATGRFLGERLHAAKDAVQPGRRIATLDRSAGSRVAMAFMSAER